MVPCIYTYIYVHVSQIIWNLTKQTKEAIRILDLIFFYQVFLQGYIFYQIIFLIQEIMGIKSQIITDQQV